MRLITTSHWLSLERGNNRTIRLTNNDRFNRTRSGNINHLIATLKSRATDHHSNTVIDTLAVDGWAVTFGTARRQLGGAENSEKILINSCFSTYLDCLLARSLYHNFQVDAGHARHTIASRPTF